MAFLPQPPPPLALFAAGLFPPRSQLASLISLSFSTNFVIFRNRGIFLDAPVSLKELSLTHWLKNGWESHIQIWWWAHLPKSQENCFQIFCTGEINPFSFAEQIVQPGKCGTYCWRIILGDFLQRQYHTFCPCATLLLSTREAGQLFSAFCKLQYLSEHWAHLPIPNITSVVALTPPKILSIRELVVCFWHSL